MGRLKQLHIDCMPNQCLNPDTNSSICPLAWTQDQDEPSPEAGTNDGGDYNAGMDEDKE